jgi:hypothetical protein
MIVCGLRDAHATVTPHHPDAMNDKGKQLIRLCDLGLRGIPRVNVVLMDYDRNHQDNLHFPAKSDRRDNITWTLMECSKAVKGFQITSLKELQDEVRTHYTLSSVILFPY